MIWIVLTVAVLVCGLLLCCVYLLSNKICSLKRQVRELNEKIGIANCFPEYSRVYLNDTPVGKGRQIRIRCGLYNKASRLIPFMAPGMSVSVYVSNIVEEHLKRHGELLKNELECYLLYSVYGWRRRIETVCTLLYGKPCVKKENKEAAGTESAVSDAEVMGSTRYVYLDENAGKTAAPFMSQPLERNFIGEEEDVQQEDVECNLQLDKMKLLQEVQEDLDAESPEVESVSPVLSSRDMEVLGEYLTHQDEADHEKAMQAARVLFSIRQTSLIDVFLSNMENSAIVEELIDRYLDEDGNPKPLKVKDGNEPSDEWRKYI